VTAIAFDPVPSCRLGLPVAVFSDAFLVDRSDVLPVADGQLARREHEGRAYFVRRFARPASPARRGVAARGGP
jgi:hypothetical protein